MSLFTPVSVGVLLLFIPGVAFLLKNASCSFIIFNISNAALFSSLLPVLTIPCCCFVRLIFEVNTFLIASWFILFFTRDFSIFSCSFITALIASFCSFVFWVVSATMFTISFCFEACFSDSLVKDPDMANVFAASAPADDVLTVVLVVTPGVTFAVV